MFLSRFGSLPRISPRAPARAAIIAVAALAAGCSSTKQSQYQYPGDPQWGANPAVAQGPQVRVRKPVVEDDGLEAQPEPPRRQAVEPDDPSEPFSPNYGNRPGDPPRRAIEPPRRAPAGNGEGRVRAADAPPIPADLPPYFKRRIVSADTE